jgi:hypothetical protein
MTDNQIKATTKDYYSYLKVKWYIIQIKGPKQFA